MQELGIVLLLVGVLNLGFTAYHYLHARAYSSEADAGGDGAGASKVFSWSHSLRGIGTLIMGVLCIAGGVVVLFL